MNTSFIGLAAGILTASSLIPQVYTTIKKKEVKDISTFMILVLLVGNGLWAYYGFLKDDLPIILTNSFSVIMDLIMLYLNFKYRSTASSIGDK